MHKNLRFATLFDFDPETERTFHRLNGRHQFEERFERPTSIPTMEDKEERQRTLRDFVTLGVYSQTPSITMPLMVANNFELRPTLLSMRQQSQFGGSQ